LRETLFNVLTAGNPNALVGSRWLDLFAGTGAVGIEALSRGAGFVHFVESGKDAAALIADNLKSLGEKSGFEIIRRRVMQALPELTRRRLVSNFIFLDPPYADRNSYLETLTMLSESALSDSAIVIAEHDKRFDPGEQFGNLRRVRLLKQGDAALSFYSRTTGHEPAAGLT
jgi:16S rRNA (guanine(966)-N(2))-methyltransferase RsmD